MSGDDFEEVLAQYKNGPAVAAAVASPSEGIAQNQGPLLAVPAVIVVVLAAMFYKLHSLQTVTDLTILAVIAFGAFYLLHSAMHTVAKSAFLAAVARSQGGGEPASEGVYYSAAVNAGVFVILFYFIYSYVWPEAAASVEALNAPLITAAGSLLVPAAALYAQSIAPKRFF